MSDDYVCPKKDWCVNPKCTGYPTTVWYKCLKRASNFEEEVKNQKKKEPLVNTICNPRTIEKILIGKEIESIGILKRSIVIRLKGGGVYTQTSCTVRYEENLKQDERK